MLKKIAIACAVAGSLLGASIATAAPAGASTPGASTAAALNCPSSDTVARLKASIDFAKVHRSPGTNPDNVVGQIPGDKLVCITSFGHTLVNGHYWDHGYGYNGSTKVTGYIADDLFV